MKTLWLVVATGIAIAFSSIGTTALAAAPPGFLHVDAEAGCVFGNAPHHWFKPTGDGLFFGPGKNRLPGPNPYDGRFVDHETDADLAPGNPAIGSSRPIADMEANVGEGNIKKGTAFCVAMGRDDPEN